MKDAPRDVVEFFTEPSSSDVLRLEGIISEGLELNEPMLLNDGSRPLHAAATAGNDVMVQMLLDHRAKVDVLDYHGNTPLYCATREGHVEVVRLLLDRGADPNIVNDEGCTILQNAVCFEHLEITRLLLSKGANVNAYTPTPTRTYTSKWYMKEKKTVLTFAFKLGNQPLIDELLKAGPELSTDMHLLLGIAIEKNNMEWMEMLLEKGADLEGKCVNGDTVLNAAIKSGCYDIVIMLLNKGVTIQEEDSLTLAIEYGHLNITKLLIEKGATLSFGLKQSVFESVLKNCHSEVAEWLFNADDDCKASHDCYIHSLQNAIFRGKVELAKILLDKIEDPNTILRYDKETALICATKCKLIPIIELLLKRGVDMEISDKRGYTALYYAIANYDSLDVVEIFLKWGASVHAIVDTRTQDTMLHLALHLRKQAFIELLVSKGADINVKNKSGNTFCHTLFDGNYNADSIDYAKQLVAKGADLNCANEHGVTAIELAIKERIWPSGESGIDLVKVVLEECFQVMTENVTRIKSLLVHMINFQNISLIKIVLNKVVEFYLGESVLSCKSSSLGKVNDVYGDEVSLLHVAAYNGDKELTDRLLKNGASIDVVSKGRFTPLQVALYNCNLELAQHLINKSANVSIADEQELLPFHIAFLLGDVNLAEQLYTKSCLSVSSAFENSLLHLAAYHGSIPLVNLLLTEGVNINTKDEKNNTILHIAVKIQNCDLVEFLLTHGIDKNAQGDWPGNTAFHTALSMFSTLETPNVPVIYKICQSFIKHDVDIKITNHRRDTALHKAASTPVASLMIENPVVKEIINSLNLDGDTPLDTLIRHLRLSEKVSFDPIDQIVLLTKYGGDLAMYGGRYNIESLIISQVVDLQKLVRDCKINFLALMSNYEIQSAFYKISDYKDRIAREKRQLDFMEVLLNQGFTLTRFESSLVEHIMREENLVLFQFILEKDKKLNFKVALSKAIENEKLNHIKIILDKVDVNTSDIYETALFFPEGKKRPGLNQMFLDRVQVGNSSKYFPLLVELAKTGNYLAVEQLLDKHFNINYVDSQGNTALNYAVSKGDKRMIHLLIERGADCNFCNERKESVIHIAAKAGNIDILLMCMNMGAAVLRKDIDNNTPLHKTKSYEIAQILIHQGVSVNDRNLDGRTALHCLCESNSQNHNKQSYESIEIAKVASLLIENGALINVKDKTGMTPLHLAATNNHITITTTLVESRAKMDIRDHNGQTALHHAVSNSNDDIIAYLLSSGAPTGVKDNNEATPYCMYRYGYTEQRKSIFIKQLLKENLAGLPRALERVPNKTLSSEERASCLEELEQLKLTKIDGEFSLFEILASFQNPAYLFDYSLVNLIEDFLWSDMIDRFPNYKAILRSAFMGSKRSRCYLTRQALDSMLFCERRKTMYRSYPEVVWRHVFSFLSVGELDNIIESGTN